MHFRTNYLGCSRYGVSVYGFLFFLTTDYIRTFTWDKKLEMVVKSTGILGGQGKVIIKSFIFVLFTFYLAGSF